MDAHPTDAAPVIPFTIDEMIDIVKALIATNPPPEVAAEKLRALFESR